MRMARLTTGLILLLFSVYFQGQQSDQEATLTGKLVRSMAIGGESTGWILELEPAANIDGKEVKSIQVSYKQPERLEKLQNKRVRVSGKLVHRQGVETGEQTVLEISSITKVTQAVDAPKGSFNLSGSEWTLEDLGGSRVIENSQATLTFPEAGKVQGNGSCNRFFGPAEVKGNAIKLGPLASTRMACPDAVMNQETKYLKALKAADRFELKDRYLLIYSKGLENPLRFTRTKGKAATQ